MHNWSLLCNIILYKNSKVGNHPTVTAKAAAFDYQVRSFLHNKRQKCQEGVQKGGNMPAVKLRTIGAATLAFVSALIPANAYGEGLKVGLLVPYSGVYAALGKEIDDGFMLAIEEAGMTDGISIVREDSEAKPPVGLAKARKLVLEDQVEVIAGVVSSGVLAAIRDYIDSAKTPLIVANAGNDEITGQRCSKYIMRVSFSNTQVNRPMGKWLYDRGIRKVYTLGPDYAGGHQMIEAFADAFKAAGGQVVGSDYTPFQKTQDFGPYLTKAQAANPDAIYVFYAGSEAISFVKQYASLGIKKSIPLFGAGFLTSALYVEAEGPGAEGVIAALHYVPAIDTPENKAFVKAFKGKTGRAPSEYAVQGYDAGRSLALVIKGGASDRESIAAALSKVSYIGPRGPLKIDPATNNIIQNIYVYETVASPEGLTQKIIATIPNIADAPNGCKM
jgi:branched-chain amino acid transport system substrate-binding protein